jgi:hypothetical protein
MIVTNCYCVDLLKEHRCEDCGVIGIETAIMLKCEEDIFKRHDEKLKERRDFYKRVANWTRRGLKTTPRKEIQKAEDQVDEKSPTFIFNRACTYPKPDHEY